MTANRYKQIGVDRIVRLAWMDEVASLVLAGNNLHDIKTILQTNIQKSFRSARVDVRGSLDKTITILVRTWLTPPRELESFRFNGLKLLQQTSKNDHSIVHWGMITAIYPFWAAVAAQVGRLLTLQGSITIEQVQRRLREQYGERQTVSRAAQRVIRSFVDWQLLFDGVEKGTYTKSSKKVVNDNRLIAWLVEALLYSRENGSALLRDLLSSPSLFPFELPPLQSTELINISNGIEFVRQGLDQDMVMLKEKVVDK